MKRWPTHRASFSPFLNQLRSNVRRSSTVTRPNIASLLHPTSSPSTTSKPSEGATISINGFIRSVRQQKRVAFAAIGDGTTFEPLQVVMSPFLAEGLSIGTAVSIMGEWKASPGKGQSHELHAQRIYILGENDIENYPLQKQYQPPQYLRTIPHLRSRTPFNSLLLRLRSQIIARLTNFFAERDFVQTHPPIMTSSDCEGAGEVFTITTGRANKESGISSTEFFRSPKYLTVSSQLHLEAFAQSLGNVWTLSPTFRAEKSDTPRHLSEFYMLEVEIAFQDKLSGIMDLVEDMLRDTVRHLQDSRAANELLLARAQHLDHKVDESELIPYDLTQRWAGIIRGPWPRITYAEAIHELTEALSSNPMLFGHEPSFSYGLHLEHEKYIAEKIGKGSPVFVTNYPSALKPFYMAPDEPGQGDSIEPTVACFDLLVPEVCELVGGSMREHRYRPLEKILSHSLDVTLSLNDSYEALPPNYSLAANMLAGAFAGIAEHSVMYPIDLLKTRLQVINPSPTAVYSGVSNAIMTISRVEGIRTLWRGLSSVVVGAGPAHAVYFASYETVKQAMGGNTGGKHEHHPLAAAVSGAAATITSDALMNPFDVIKQRMQLHGSTYTSIAHCARSVFRNEGVTAFYVSYPTTLTMTVPFTALQFMAYESLSKVMNPTGAFDPTTHCTAGGVAGGLAAGLTTPLDVIKTLLQTRGSSSEAEIRNCRGLWEAAQIIKRRDGYRGFWRGLKPRIITTMPSTAICWSAYEMAKAFFIAQDRASRTPP
ncbi:mitochondrial carrier [Patellaria atrata CBS 101060]|uniref:asparagine--tRNA ligase n=1 Tax=Patellaria atrata CBS 101060 TaxID=1346257 RepID=A0A9P4S5C8_9PEZI|nr:mitochondrial carrier [Patellaria atrata CBS 101060]